MSAHLAKSSSESSLSYVDIDDEVMELKELKKSSVSGSNNNIISTDMIHFRTSQQTTSLNPLTTTSMRAKVDFNSIPDCASEEN